MLPKVFKNLKPTKIFVKYSSQEKTHRDMLTIGSENTLICRVSGNFAGSFRDLKLRTLLKELNTLWITSYGCIHNYHAKKKLPRNKETRARSWMSLRHQPA